MNKQRRRIYLDGGLVTGVTGFAPHERFDVIDYDTNGEPDVCKCIAGRQEDGKNAPHFHSRRVCNQKGME